MCWPAAGVIVKVTTTRETACRVIVETTATRENGCRVIVKVTATRETVYRVIVETLTTAIAPHKTKTATPPQKRDGTTVPKSKIKNFILRR